MWSLMSAQRGHSIEDIAARLMDLSDKAKENGPQYARITAQNATAAAERVIAQGVPDPGWAAAIGSPTIGQCWHYSDVGGRQESVTVSFGYGDAEHALSVLIDHGRGGKIRDSWVAKSPGLRAETEQAAAGDPLVVFELLDAADAGRRLQLAFCTVGLVLSRATMASSSSGMAPVPSKVATNSIASSLSSTMSMSCSG